MPHMLGKSLFIILFLLLTLSLLPTQVFAAFESDILGVALTKNDNGSYLGEVSVRILADALNDMPYPSRLMVASEYIASGFKHTKAGEITLDCNVSAEAVLCTHLPSSSTEDLVYTFVWSPSDIIQKSYCYSEAGEKQVSEGAAGKYQKKISIVTKSGFPYLRKVVINGITTSGEMQDTYADISTYGRFAVLWALGSFASGDDIASVTFAGSGKYPQMAKGSGQSGSAFLPYAGSIAHFGKNANVANNLFFVNIKKEEANVEGAVFEFCQKENIEQSEYVAVLEHAILGGEQSAASSDNLTVTWDAITYPAAPTNTPTITPTSAPTATHTPTPTTNVTNSSQNTTSTYTPTPTATGSQGTVASSQATSTPTPSGQPVGSILSGGASGGDTATETARNADGEQDILGETTMRKETGSDGVIPPVSRSPDTLGDLIREPSAKTIGSILVLAIVGAFGFVMILLVVISPKSSPVRNLGIVLARVRGLLRNIFGKISKLKYIFIFFFFSFLLLCFAPSARAQATYYKITDAFTMQGTGAYTGVMSLRYVYATKVSTPGRYVISNKPDGTGSIQIGNYLSVWVQHTYWHSMQSRWVGPADNTYSAHFKCPSQTTLEPQDVSSWFYSTGTYQLTFRFITSCYQSFPVSDMYLVYLPDPTPTPTATPTSTPTPTVAPFLDLPWDYKGKDLTFSQAAIAMTSYFDHEYPFLSKESLDNYDDGSVTIYKDKNSIQFSYPKHDGYDYGKISQANYDDPQLAAASGIATFHNDFWQQGNAIYIDHGNSFQTRYYHLDHKDLITSDTSKEISVKQGQMIGRIGYTGNVDPKGEDGAHIHLMLVFDKNHDGEFDDNIPDGLVDPYGWEGEAGTDPWENATFQYPWGTERTGMQSRYLWKYDLFTSKLLIDQNKKSGLIDGEGFDIDIDDLVIGDQESLEFITRIVPADVKSSGDNEVEKLGVVIDLVIKDENGDHVRYLRNPFNLIIDLLRPDIKDSIKPESVKIMSSKNNGITWQEEITVIDWENKKAMAYIDHATLFAVVGEKKDTTPPESTISASGLGKGISFRSDVTLDIQALDTDTDTLGIEYTLYTLDSEYDWQEYLSPITVASSGAHFVKAFSADKSGNIETAKRIDFTIDKEIPEIGIRYSTSSAGFVFSGLDGPEILDPVQEINTSKVTAEDAAGNIHELNYEVTEEGGMHTLHIIGGSKNGVAIDYGSSTYAITSDNTHEYLQSDTQPIRIIQGASGEPYIIDADDIRIYTGQRPLQLETSDGRLKIDD